MGSHVGNREWTRLKSDRRSARPGGGKTTREMLDKGERNDVDVRRSAGVDSGFTITYHIRGSRKPGCSPDEQTSRLPTARGSQVKSSHPLRRLSPPLLASRAREHLGIGPIASRAMMSKSGPEPRSHRAAPARRPTRPPAPPPLPRPARAPCSWSCWVPTVPSAWAVAVAQGRRPAWLPEYGQRRSRVLVYAPVSGKFLVVFTCKL